MQRSGIREQLCHSVRRSRIPAFGLHPGYV
jgi:hypothetical protein